MQFKVDKFDFAKALGRAQAVASAGRKHAMPILGSACIEASAEGWAEVRSSDLEVLIASRIPATVKTPGGICLEAQRLHDVIRFAPDEPVHIATTKNNYATVKCGSAEARLAGSDLEEYPMLTGMTPEDAGGEFALEAEALLQGLLHCAYAASVDETRYHLNGVHIHPDGGRIAFVATDGHRLALSHLTAPEAAKALPEAGLTIPSKGVTEIQRLCREFSGSLTLQAGTTALSIEADKGAVRLGARLTEGEFPAYQQIIPKDFAGESNVDGPDLLNMLRFISTTAPKRQRATTFSFAQNQIGARTTNVDVGEAQQHVDATCTVPPDKDGKPIEVGMNAAYLQEAIEHLGAKAAISLHITEPNKPVLVRAVPAGDEAAQDAFAIIMPMRL